MDVSEPAVLLGRFNPQDVNRLAEFFDGSVDAVYAFARDTWLPDAQHVALALCAAVLARDGERIAFLSSRLRDGALLVGAEKISFQATCLELAAGAGRWQDAAYLCKRVRAALREIADWLLAA